MPTCIVLFVDLDGVRHSVEVLADGLYEAAVLGLSAFKKLDFQPGGLTNLEVEVRSAITHTLTVQKVHHGWNGVSGLQKRLYSKNDCELCSKFLALLTANLLSITGRRSLKLMNAYFDTSRAAIAPD